MVVVMMMSVLLLLLLPVVDGVVLLPPVVLTAVAVAVHDVLDDNIAAAVVAFAAYSARVVVCAVLLLLYFCAVVAAAAGAAALLVVVVVLVVDVAAGPPNASTKIFILASNITQLSRFMPEIRYTCCNMLATRYLLETQIVHDVYHHLLSTIFHPTKSHVPHCKKERIILQPLVFRGYVRFLWGGGKKPLFFLQKTANFNKFTPSPLGCSTGLKGLKPSFSGPPTQGS